MNRYWYHWSLSLVLARFPLVLRPLPQRPFPLVLSLYTSNHPLPLDLYRWYLFIRLVPYHYCTRPMRALFLRHVDLAHQEVSDPWQLSTRYRPPYNGHPNSGNKIRWTVLSVKGDHANWMVPTTMICGNEANSFQGPVLHCMVSQGPGLQVQFLLVVTTNYQFWYTFIPNACTCGTRLILESIL